MDNQKYYEYILSKCPLFSGIDTVDLRSLLMCLSATTKHYSKDDYIFRVGDFVTAVGIILFGSAHIIQEDFWGNRTILSHVSPSELFAESFSCAEIDKLPVSVVATVDTEIILIDYKRIMKTCSSACTFHAGLIQNMMQILARKNVLLTQKMEHMTQHTTREKLLSYLSAQAMKAGSNAFIIPFNRQELADYLSVDRSAMSNELSKMRDEGILKCRKNCFTLESNQ
jgi:CRP-like cAMP-binding protein